MKRNTELQISQTQKKCNKTEELLLEEIEVIAAAQAGAGEMALLSLLVVSASGGARGTSP